MAYEQATKADLAEAVRRWRPSGRRIVAHQAAVRDQAAVQAVLDGGVGRIDMVPRPSVTSLPMQQNLTNHSRV